MPLIVLAFSSVAQLKDEEDTTSTTGSKSWGRSYQNQTTRKLQNLESNNASGSRHTSESYNFCAIYLTIWLCFKVFEKAVHSSGTQNNSEIEHGMKCINCYSDKFLKSHIHYIYFVHSVTGQPT